MKNILFIILCSVLAVIGCKSSTKESHEHDGGIHTHENGEIHQNHDTIQQQEFTVDRDSSAQENQHQIKDSVHSHPH